MKRYVILFLLLTTLVSARAIEPIRYGITAGMNSSTLSTDGTKSRVGFNVGMKAQLPITTNFYLESSLLFSLKGYKSDSYFTNEQQEIKITQKNYYLELPIHAGYKFEMSDDFSIFVSGGGYLGMGLFGKVKNKIGNSSTSYDMYKDGRGDKRFDCGLGLKAGVEFKKKIQLSGGYDWGLLDIHKYANDAKNRNLMVSCSYIF